MEITMSSEHKFESQAIQSPRSNIDSFNEITAKTFGILYASFPVPTTLSLANHYGIDNVANIAKSLEHGLRPCKEEEAPARLVEATICWLEDSGYLKIKLKNYPFKFEGVILTAKGLEALQAVPDSINSDKKSAGQILAEQIKAGTGDYVRETVKTVLSFGVKLAIGS